MVVECRISSIFIYIYTFIYKTNPTVPLNFQAWSTIQLLWPMGGSWPPACHCHDDRNCQDQSDLSFLLGFPKRQLLVACCGPLWKWRYDMFLRTASTKIQNAPNAFRWPSTTWSKRQWARRLLEDPIRSDSRLPSTQQAQVTRYQPETCTVLRLQHMSTYFNINIRKHAAVTMEVRNGSQNPLHPKNGPPLHRAPGTYAMISEAIRTKVTPAILEETSAEKDVFFLQKLVTKRCISYST